MPMIPFPESKFMASLASEMLENDMFLPRSAMMNNANDANPRPPSCIRTASTTLPNTVNVLAISTVVRPVTHTELTDTNRQSR